MLGQDPYEASEPTSEEAYKDLINEYKARLAQPEKEISWQERLPDILSAAHNTINYAKGNPMDNIKTNSIKNAMASRDKKKAGDLSGLENLQKMQQNYMNMQRTRAQDTEKSKRYKTEKETSDSRYADKQTTDKSKFDYKKQMESQLSPYQKAMLAQNKEMSPYQKQQLSLAERKFEAEGKKGDITPYQKATLAQGKEKLDFEKEKANKSTKKVELTVGQEATDRKFGKQYSDYILGGGAKQAKADIGSLEKVLKDLEDNQDVFTGPLDTATEFLGGFDTVRAAINPRLQDMKSRLEQIIQQDLRTTLGAQFTEKEGKNFLERSFDPKLSAKVNIARLKDFVKKVKSRHEQIEDAGAYFNEHNGTMSGYKQKGSVDNLDLDTILVQSPNGRQRAKVKKKDLQKYLEKGATIIEE